MLSTNAKRAFSSNKKVVENLSFLTVLKILEMGLPIIVYPYLISVVGTSKYGVYVFGFSIVQYFVIFTTFGFNSNIVQLISIHRHSKKSIGYIISCVLSIKLFAFIFSIISVLLYAFFLKQKEFYMYFFLLGNLVFAFMMPLYFFRGVEEMKWVTIVSIFAKLFSLILIFLFVEGVSDYTLIPLAFSSGHFIVLTYAYVHILGRKKIKISFIKPSRLGKLYKNTLPFFYASVSGILKDRSAFIIIGRIISMEAVALYDLAFKVANLVYSMISNFSAAFFPKVVKSGTKMMKKNLLFIQISLGIFAYLLLILFGPFIVEILGDGKMNDSYFYLTILGLIVPLYLTTNGLDLFYILPSLKFHLVTQSLLIALVSFFSFVSVGVLFHRSVSMVALSLVLSAITEALYRLYMLNKLTWKNG